MVVFMRLRVSCDRELSMCFRLFVFVTCIFAVWGREFHMLGLEP